MLIVAFTSFCGYVFAKKYRKKKNFFIQMKEFNERFLSEVAYYKRPIGDFIAQFSYEGEFSELLERFFTRLKSDGEEKLSEEDFSDYPFLTKDERAFIADYFLMLGRGDSASQKAYFSAQKPVLEQYKTSSVETCKKYGDLYIKLGFLLGLAILVLIV